MWVIGLYLSGVFLFGLMPLFLCFRGGAVRYSFFFGSFLTSCVFFVGLCPFGNKFLFIQKKKKNIPTYLSLVGSMRFCTLLL